MRGIKMKKRTPIKLPDSFCALLEYLRNRGYAESSVLNYESHARWITQFMRENGYDAYTAEAYAAVLKHVDNGVEYEALSEFQKRRYHCATVLYEFQQTGNYTFRRKKAEEVLQGGLKKDIESFMEYRKPLLRAGNTEKQYRLDLLRFNIFLDEMGICDVSQITTALILQYIQERMSRFTQPVIRHALTSIRQFLFYLHETGRTEANLSLVVPNCSAPPPQKIPSIYSKEEIVKEFQMFDNNVKDSIDKKIALLREVRELYNSDRELYRKIKALPMKSRVMRDTGKHSGKSIIFVSSNVKTEFYLATPTGVEVIDFLEAVKYLKAKPEEQPVPFANEEQHYKHINSALAQYTAEYVEAADTSSINRTDLDKTSLEANKFLRTIKQITTDSELKSQCDVLMGYINEGIYAQLPRYLKALSREYKNDRAKMKKDEYILQNKISELLGEYQTMNKDQRHDAQDISNPQIIISESFK